MSSSRRFALWFSAGLLLVAGCGEKIGEDPFESITGSGTGDSGGESVGEADTSASATSAGTSASTTASTTTSATSADSGGSESGPIDCSTCVAPPPEGWFGPVALAFGAIGEPTPECGGNAYVDSSLTLLSGYHDPGPAQCDCECELQASFCQTY